MVILFILYIPCVCVFFFIFFSTSIRVLCDRLPVFLYDFGVFDFDQNEFCGLLCGHAHTHTHLYMHLFLSNSIEMFPFVS